MLLFDLIDVAYFVIGILIGAIIMEIIGGENDD